MKVIGRLQSLPVSRSGSEIFFCWPFFYKFFLPKVFFNFLKNFFMIVRESLFQDPNLGLHFSVDQRLMPKRGLKSRIPRIMPGLPKGPFLEKPVKRPDSIRVKYNVHSARGAHFAIFMIWVDFPFGKRGWTEWRRSGKKARQNAIGCIRTHYMHLNLGLFSRMGHLIKPALPSERRFYDGDGRRECSMRSEGNTGSFQKNFR
jgi:hypothetical protein